MVAALQETPTLAPVLEEKYYRLIDYLSRLDGAITAFSGGVDSSLVAYLAHCVLGDRALAVTSCSESLTGADEVLTRELAEQWGMAHRAIHTGEINNPDYRANPVNRCYFCKSTLYRELAKLAQELEGSALLNGTNQDDLGDHRPGLEAAREFGVLSPLSECELGKVEIRILARHLGLENAEKPQAACLSSRVPYGLEISTPVLKQVEQAEAALRELGFAQLRVRHHGEIARIEVMPEQFDKVLANREVIERQFRLLGYRYTTLDLKGFRSGSLNEGL